MLLEQQIAILEWFLKDHVILKTGVIVAENSSFMIFITYIFFLSNKRDGYTRVESEASLFAHVEQPDGDAVASSRLQALQRVLHCVVLSAHLIVLLRFTNCISHVHCVHLIYTQRCLKHPIWHITKCFIVKQISLELDYVVIPKDCWENRMAAATSEWPVSYPLAPCAGFEVEVARWGSSSLRHRPMEARGMERSPSPEQQTHNHFIMVPN